MSEQGHAKNLEAFGKLIAFGETLDQTRLNPPPDLTIAALVAMRAGGTTRQAAVGNFRADWRTIALDRAKDIVKFAPLAAQMVGQLAGRGASKETVKDARGYVRKLQGKRSSPPPVDDPSTPDIDESEKAISASQRSAAQSLALMYELIDFLEAQGAYASVTQAGLSIADARAFVDATQAKHDASIEAEAALKAGRNDRNQFFYLSDDSMHSRVQRYKELVKGSYGSNSAEYKTVRAIEFKKR